MKSTNYYVMNSPKYDCSGNGNEWKPGSSTAAALSDTTSKDSLESLISGRVTIIEAGIKQVEEEIDVRYSLHNRLVEELDRQLCIQKGALMQVAPYGNLPFTVGDPRRRSALEKEMATLEGDKRHEMIAVWKDVASLKSERRTLLQELYSEQQRQSVMRL